MPEPPFVRDDGVAMDETTGLSAALAEHAQDVEDLESVVAVEDAGLG